MTRQIFKNVFLLTISVFFSCVIVLTAVVYHHFGSRKSEELRSGLEWIQAAMEAGDRSFLERVAQDQRMRVTWVAANGEVLYDSLGDRVTDNHGGRKEIAEALASGYGESVRFSQTVRQRTFNCAVRLRDGTVVRVSAVQYTISAILLSMFAQIVVLLLMALLLSAAMSARVSKLIIAPINEISLSSPDERDVYQELRPLVQRINRQNRQIHRQMDALQQEHEKQDRMRQEFTANVSHELKTPLTTISGTAEILQAGLVRPEDVPRFAGNIYTEAQRMIVLVNDILRLAQLDQPDRMPDMTEVDLYAVCCEQMDRLRTVAEEKQVRFALEGGPAPVWGVPQMLEEIVYNLCDNAVKYNRERGTVAVSVRSCPEGVKLTVSDTGIGIPEAQVQRIFERFYRVDKSHSREMGGTGLGLSIVKHAAQLHRASIRVDSRLHRGTDIEICFPPYKNLEDTTKP